MNSPASPRSYGIRARRFSVWLLLLLAGPGLSAHAQRDLKNLPDPDPEVERQSFQTPDDVEVTLWAAEPLLYKPIQMNFDEQGRLWVACSKSYPQIKPGEVADDEIVVLEDTDRDGKADRSTVFADGLMIPTGVIPGDGGAYVANSTELLHLADNDNDGKADRSRVMLSGFGTEDTHHIIHTLRWGYDGRLFFNQSVYIHSYVETPFGPRRLDGAGIWRFEPGPKRLEVFIRGLVNPWGHHYDRHGTNFGTDGAGFEGIAYLWPGASYTAISNPPRYLHGLNPGSPKYCGAEIISGAHVPEAYRGQLVTNDFRANRVVRFALSEDGSGFAAREQTPLIESTHVAFRPIDVKMGPDGAIYIADWYNPIIQHGEVDFRDDRRDHLRGRIWRIAFRDRKPVDPPSLASAEVPALLDALTADEGYTREQARRLLREQGPEAVLDPLRDWLAQAESDTARLEALWLFQALNTPEPALLDALLNSTDANVRAAAVRVASDWGPRLTDPLTLLGSRVHDAHPRVRLEATRALAALNQADAVALAMQALDSPVDLNLDYALWLLARESAPLWLPDIQQERPVFASDAHLVYALLALDRPETIDPLMRLYEAGRIPADLEDRALTAIGSLGNPRDLGRIFDLVIGNELPSARRTRLLDALVEAQRRRKVQPDCPLDRLALILADGQTTPELRAAAARAAGAWRLETLRPYLTSHIAMNPNQEWPVRQAAIGALVELGGPESLRALRDLDDSGQQARVREAAIVGLATIDLNEAAQRAAALLAGLDPAAPGLELGPMVSAFTTRDGGSAALIQALEKTKLSTDIARLAIRAARLSGTDQTPLTQALSRAGGLDAQASWSKLGSDQIQQLIADVDRQGDPARGEAIFRRDDLSCFKCHAIAGAGSNVGPGLESIGASAPIDYLVESMLNPDKAIKEGYHSVVIATADGQILTGRQTGTDGGRILLQTADFRTLSIDPNDIEEQKQGGSLMPGGLIDELTRAELLDLVAFLSRLGKPGPWAVGTQTFFRTWSALEPNEVTNDRIRRDGMKSLAQPAPADSSAGSEFPSRQVYSQVSGALPLDELPVLRPYHEAPPLNIVRTAVEVTTPGTVEIHLNQVEGVSLWIDGLEQPVEPLMTPELSTGIHVFTFAIDRTRFPESALAVRLSPAPDSPAQARPVLGP